MGILNGFYRREKNYCAFELNPLFRHNKIEEDILKLYEKIKGQLLDKKKYYGYRWDEDIYHILNRENMDLFQLSKEERNLVLYPFDRCQKNLMMAYTMNKMRGRMKDDEREIALREAVYGCLG